MNNKMNELNIQKNDDKVKMEIQCFQSNGCGGIKKLVSVKRQRNRDQEEEKVPISEPSRREKLEEEQKIPMKAKGRKKKEQVLHKKRKPQQILNRERQKLQAEVEEENPKIVLLDRYLIKSKVSEGGFGKVYKCQDMITKANLIAKVNPGTAMNDNEYNIAMVMSGTQGFPTIYGKGMLDELPFIVMQQLGLTMYDLIRRNNKHFGTKTVVSIGIALINLIERMHDKGFIHCDIKPDNIMIGNF